MYVILSDFYFYSSRTVTLNLAKSVKQKPKENDAANLRGLLFLTFLRRLSGFREVR